MGPSSHLEVQLGHLGSLERPNLLVGRGLMSLMELTGTSMGDMNKGPLVGDARCRSDAVCALEEDPDKVESEGAKCLIRGDTWGAKISRFTARFSVNNLFAVNIQFFKNLTRF